MYAQALSPLLLKQVIYNSRTAQNLLGCNNLASHELRGGVGEVLHVCHDSLESGLVGGSLLEVVHAAPLEGGLDAVGSIISELEDLRRCQTLAIE